MFVESMSFEEIRKEIISDIDVVKSKFQMQIKTICKLKRKTNMSVFKKYYDYRSPVNKNQWLYSIEIRNPKSNNGQIRIMSQFTTRNGYCAVMYLPDKQETDLFHSHFFTRYNQRSDIGLVLPKEIMIAFLNDNPQFLSHLLVQKSPTEHEAFIQFKYGVGLGSYHSHIKFYDIRSFISNQMLKGNQIKLSKNFEEKYPQLIERKP
jgi:hypothetical protein